jgi:hypothetical protein
MDSKIPGNLLTTAMAVMPHTDVERALEMALSLDVPFWPQLPNFIYYEDMYVQAAEHFPGIVLDIEKRRLRFSMDKFADEIEAALLQFDNPAMFDVCETGSAVYHRFLADRPAIRGQLEGPISFGFNILDQDERPILFDDTVRPFMLEFMAKALSGELRITATENEDVRSLAQILTIGCKGIAAYTDHAAILGHEKDEIHGFLMEAFASTTNALSTDEMIAMVMKAGETAVNTMALMDEANTTAYGHPEITEVNIGVGNDPGVLISGHDLKDMEELLKQTGGTGIEPSLFRRCKYGQLALCPLRLHLRPC